MANDTEAVKVINLVKCINNMSTKPRKGLKVGDLPGEHSVLHKQIKLCGQFYRASDIYGLHRGGQSTCHWCPVQGHGKRDVN